MKKPKTTHPTENPQANPASDAIEPRVVAFAEQLGHLVGTVKARADGWLDRRTLNDQVARIRDNAVGLLRHLGGGEPAGEADQGRQRKAVRKRAVRATATDVPGGRSGGKVDAPGKAHRKAPARTQSVRHSDETVPKLKAARQARRARRG